MKQNQSLIKKIYEKLCIRQWTIGLAKGSINEIIEERTFNPDIKWSPIEPFRRFYADPFFYASGNEKYILAEEFDYRENYGKISLLFFDESLNLKSSKVLLDTQSHLSYPFIFEENNRTYIFPEAGKSGKLSCYEFEPKKQELSFLKTIIDFPVMDPTVLKHNNKYWIFGTMYGENARRNLFIFFSDNILGPYELHPGNPVTDSLNGSRPAGNFINVDGTLFRPAQNCENRYGESITLNKITELNEINYREEPHMVIEVNKKNKRNKGIQTIHTINILDNLIVVDGQKRKFTPFSALKKLVLKAFTNSQRS